MEFVKMFLSEYGTAIAYMIICGVFTYLGVKAKGLADKYLDTKIKKDVARTVVQAVEQIYRDLHGEEKLNQALISAAEMLEQKGIMVTDLELRMLIEAAVGEFNKNFNGETTTEELPE